MFTARETTEIRRPTPAVFALIDDFARLPSWLDGCKSLQATPPAAREVGTPLRYQYTMVGQEGTMAGRITAYAPEQEVAMHFTDSNFDVDVSFKLEATEFGTRVHHAIAIEPKFQMPRYMEAMAQAGNRKQVGNNVTKLKRLVESTSEPPAVP